MKRVMISLLGALAFAAAAQAAEPLAMPATQAAQVAPAADIAPAADEAKKPDVNDRTCLRHTGTRIATQADSRVQRKCSGAIGSAYTRDDLQRTGEVDIADALRKLDPSIR